MKGCASLITNFLNSKKAESYVDVIVMVIASTMVIIITINCFSLLTKKQTLDYFAKELLNSAAVSGRIGSETYARFAELRGQTGLSPSVSWSANYFDPTQMTVQLAETISVTLTFQTSFQGTGEMNIIPLTLTSKASALSMRYWK